LEDIWSLSAVVYTFEYFCHQGRQKDATAGQQRLGHDLTKGLRKLIQPYFLRRTKQDVGMVESGTSAGKGMKSGTAGGAKYVVV